MEQQITGEKKYLNIDYLYLDPNNYRFINHKDYEKVKNENICNEQIQKRTSNFIIGEKQKNILDLLDSFKANGYLEVDQIQVEEIEEKKYKVIEGNRRVATLKLLQSQNKESGLTLGKINAQIFRKLPVIIYPKLDDGHVEIVMGLKHINGNKKWEVLNQAQLLDDLIKKYNWNEERICQSLGITKHRLNKYRRALSLVEDFKKSDYGDLFETEMFAIFVEIISNLKMKEWISWNDKSYKPQNKINTERLYRWLVEIEENVFDENYNETATKKLEKIVLKSRDIWTISKFLDDENALENMEKTRSILDAYSSSKRVGTDKFNSSLDIIKNQINEARNFSSYREIDSKDTIKSLIGKLQALALDSGFSEIAFNKDSQKDIFIRFKNEGFSEIDLLQFKQFLNLKIENINRINIFAGINNSGKSSILEAIYLLCKQNDLNAFFDMHRRRGKFYNQLPYFWLKNEFQTSYKLNANFDNKKLNYQAKKFQTEADINKADYIDSIHIKTNFAGENLNSYADIFEKNKIQQTSKKINWLCNISFSNPFSLQNQDDIVFFHRKSVELQTYDKIISFLQKYVDNGIEKIIYVGDINRFKVYHKSFKETIDLTQFGEGIQGIFFISLQMATAINGVMCIDEIENAIHHSLFKNFVNFLVELSLDLNVQLFISSHSLECIDAFLHDKINLEKISVYRLEEKNDKALIKYASGEKYSRLRNSLGTDLRG